MKERAEEKGQRGTYLDSLMALKWHLFLLSAARKCPRDVILFNPTDILWLIHAAPPHELLFCAYFNPVI